MKAYVTSIGERTTQICCQQLRRYGYGIELLDEVEPWKDKYVKFVRAAIAKGDAVCMRIDADVIPNKQIKLLTDDLAEGDLMKQYWVFDFYSNNTIIGGPVLYTLQALKIIEANFDKLDDKRPEASASRLLEVNPWLVTSRLVMGMHGFFQNEDSLERARKHKIERKQIKDYDFELAHELLELFGKYDNA